MLLLLLASFLLPASGLLLSPYVQSGRPGDLALARALSRVRLNHTALRTDHTSTSETSETSEDRHASDKNKSTDYGYAGYFSVPAQHLPAERLNHIYFWYQPCTECADASSSPLLVWLQGGPGGPGTFGAMTEIGNWWVEDDGSTVERCFSWCKKNSCLFVDQPVEAGFSYQTDVATGAPITKLSRVDLTDTSPAAMAQVHGVLTQFLTVFPELKPAPLVIAGESYGGLYTPNLGVLLAKDPDINFVKLAVGDPCINGKYQWGTYADTLYGMGVLMKDEREQIRAIMDRGVAKLQAFEDGAGTCRDAFKEWNSVWDDDGHDSGTGTDGLFTSMTGSTMTEDILMTASPASFDNFMLFFQRPEIAKAFHISNFSKKVPLNQTLPLEVYDAFVDSGDFCTNSSLQYAELLDAGIDVMIYSSTVDPLLGPPTTEGGIDGIMADARRIGAPNGAAAKLADAYYASKKTLWAASSQEDQTAGYAKCAGGRGGGGQQQRFCYVVVRNAGHMTPAFQPRASLEMLGRFLTDRSFDGKKGQCPASYLPVCAQCGGSGPFAGAALPACAKKQRRDEL
jgi:vitellogenic carboxypeptidase-like protein